MKIITNQSWEGHPKLWCKEIQKVKNFGTKSILSQNRGHVFAPNFGKEAQERENPKKMALRDRLRKRSMIADIGAPKSAIFWMTTTACNDVGEERKDVSDSTRRE